MSFTSSLVGNYKLAALGKCQACHRCRERKLRWQFLRSSHDVRENKALAADSDARRPICDTCRRSHNYALRRSRAKESVPPIVDCAYDEDATPDPHGQESSMLENLQSVLEKLEMNLEDQDAAIQKLLAQHASLVSPSQIVAEASTGNTLRQNYSVEEDFFDSTARSEDGGPEWPLHIPPPELLHHLVDVFFTSFPYASRMFYRLNFETSLALSPNSPTFPQSYLLNAVCAVASFYAGYIIPLQPRSYGWRNAANFVEELMVVGKDITSFAELQAYYASRSLSTFFLTGEHANLDVLRTYTLLSHFHHVNARFTRSWHTAGLAIRLATTLGLHAELPPDKLCWSLDSRGDFSTLSPTSDAVEEEVRRNCFWLTYITERMMCLGFGWNQMISEADVLQRLPIIGSHLNYSSLASPRQRQRSDDPLIFMSHPLEQTDPFIILVKGIMLISKAKEFCTRYYRQAEQHHESSVTTTIAFQKISQLIQAFEESIPKPFRDPWRAGSLDVSLFLALNIPSAAMLILHSPHANHSNPHCPASQQVIRSVRKVLQLLSEIVSTSTDMSLIDPVCSSIWLISSQSLLSAALARAQTGDLHEAHIMRSELDVFTDAFCKVAERFPIALRHFRWLTDDMLANLDPLLRNG